MKQHRKLRSVVAVFLVLAIVLPLCPTIAIAASTFDVSQWDTTGWTQTTERGHTVLTADPSTDNAALLFLGNLYGATSIEAEMRYNQTRWGEASGGFVLYTAAGDEWYVDYRADANAVRIRRNGSYVTYNTLGFTPAADKWVHFELAWDDANLYILVNGEAFLSANYADYGDVFDGGSTFKFYEWGQPMSLRTIQVNYSISALWDAPTASVSKENGSTVLTVSGESDTLIYKGNMNGVNAIEADIRSSGSLWGEASNGICIYTQEGVEWFIDYRKDEAGNGLRIRRNGNYMTYTAEGLNLPENEWQHWKISWDGVRLYAYIDGKLILSYEYASLGDSFGPSSAPAKLYHWGRPFSVKNIELSGPAWQGEHWSVADENGTTVYTPSNPESGSDANASARLDYYGDLDGSNAVELDVRYNQSCWEEASAGIILYTEKGVEWFVDYRADASSVRIRRNGEYITYTALTNAPKADEWSHWSISWDDTQLTISMDGKDVLYCDYATYGDDLRSGVSMCVYHWGQPLSVKNMKLSKVAGSEADLSDWKLDQWTAKMEGKDIVFTADADTSSDSGNTLTYLKDFGNTNCIDFQLRYNQSRWEEASAGLKLYADNGACWFVDYRADAGAVRIRRNDVYVTYTSLSAEANAWMDWRIKLEDGKLFLYVDDQLLLEANYSAYGDTFGEHTMVAFYAWGQPSSVKNVTLQRVEILPDTSDWELGGWTAGFEGEESVFTGNADTTGNRMKYTGNVDGHNSVSFQLRYNQSRWGEASAGIILHTKDGTEWFIDYRADANAFRIRRNGQYITYTTESRAEVGANQWMDIQVFWSATTLYLKVDGEMVLETNYASYGDAFDRDISLQFYEWGQPSSIKNVKLSKQSVNGWQPNSSWTKETEDGGDVYTAQLPEMNDGLWPTLSYNGSLKDINSIAYQLRYNRSWFEEAWGGLILTESNGNVWNVDYRADANAVRIRRNGSYVAYTTLNFVPESSDWMDFRVIWSDTTLYLKVADEIVLEAKYSTFGDVFNADTSAYFQCWGQPISVKKIAMENVKPSEWNFVDLEFDSPYSAEVFKVLGGSAMHQDGQMIVNITAGGMSLESGRIEVSPGSMYSAFLPVRNTLVVRLKNDTAANEIKLYFISTLHQQYSEMCSKSFEIEPYSDYTTYFFNLSDVIYMGSAADPYKYTSQVMDSEGYLRGFKLVLPENVSEGSIAIDAITFEREDPLYDYLGQIVSTVADKEKKTITITGKVDPSLAGETVTIYESAVNNYNEGMSYPINTEHDTQMVEIEKLVTAKVKTDGTFSTTIALYAEDEISRLSSLFLAWIGDQKVAGDFSVDNYEDFSDVERFEVPDLKVLVTDPQFGAKGDGFTDDTKAIQAAIDYVAAQGGGVVILPGDTSTWYGRRYIATNINLKSNIELRIEKGAMIWQSQREEDYDYSNNVFTDKPIYGHDNDREGVVWAHSINDNLPLIYVGGGYNFVTEEWGDAITNVRITGGGTIRMMDTGGEQPDPHNYAWNSNICVGCANRIHIAPVVFWNANNCDLVDITIQRTNSWHVTTSGCDNMYYANNTLEQAACINSDSFGCSNSKNITIFRNFVYGNDDGVTLSTFAEEKRAHVFYFVDPDRDNSIENINIISNQIWNGLGIAFIPWGSGGEDASRYLTKNILIYDNVLGGESCAIGSWPDNPTYGWSSYYSYNLDNGETDDWSAIQDVKIINNRLRKPYNLRVVQVSNLIIENTAYKGELVGYYQSRATTNFLHGDFDKVIRSTQESDGFKDESNWVVGLTNWSSVLGENGSVGTEKIREDLKYSGYVRGNAELWQGIYLMLGAQKLTMKVYAQSGTATVFVADQNGKVIQEMVVENNNDFEQIELQFTVPSSGSYRLGVKHKGTAQEVVYLDDANVQRCEINSTEIIGATTITYPFNSNNELKDFKLFSSATQGGFQVLDGKLAAVGTDGEFKAVLKNANRKYWSASVEIYPGASDEINAGLYIGATGGSNSLDQIRALGILVESNFTGWNDAANRVDLVIGSFPNWTELGRYTAETGAGNALFTDGNKQPLKLSVEVRDTIVTVTLALLNNEDVFIQAVFEYTGSCDLHNGNIGLRANLSDVQFDNLTLKFTEAEEDNKAEVGDKATDTVNFDSADSAKKFDFYSSSKGGFVIKDGKLSPTGEEGEFKAIYKNNGAQYSSVSVDIYPNADGEINAGLYIGATKVGDGVDKIKALGILVESNFSGWDDAINRIDLVVGQFPIWKELHRFTSETGNGNALYVGEKEPVNLRVDIDGKLVTITLRLISDPSVFVTTVYEYTGSDDLTKGSVGIRSSFSGAAFDNFKVYCENENAKTGDYMEMAIVMPVMLISLVCLITLNKKKYTRKHS